MRTSEEECIESLREAAEILGKSPTKAEYEELGLTPASATIQRVMGGWNDAKEAAGLETNRSTGSRVQSKPDHVELPDGKEWDELTVDQRWHYRNAEWNKERTLARRARLREWINERKSELGCTECGRDDPAYLDLHHRDDADKEMAITDMITYGYGRDALRDEMAKCEVLCANCHRKEHYDDPKEGPELGEDVVRGWVHRVKQSSDGCRQCGEDDPACLDFHHDGAEKESTVARMVADDRPKREIRTEMAKCTLLCANCHRREHHEPPAPPGKESDTI